MSAYLVAKRLFESAPLPAEFCLMRRAPRDCFRVVFYQRQAAEFETLSQPAQEREPLLDQFAEFGKRRVDIIHDGRPSFSNQHSAVSIQSSGRIIRPSHRHHQAKSSSLCCGMSDTGSSLCSSSYSTVFARTAERFRRGTGSRSSARLSNPRSTGSTPFVLNGFMIQSMLACG